MMKNSIEAHVEFSFKGESYDLSSILDPDLLLAQHDTLPEIHAILARDHKIDTYSYLHEVMQEAEITYRNAQGTAADFLSDGHFNWAAYAAHRQDSKTLALLRPIALNTLGIADLEQHAGLKNALIQAYNLGRGSDQI